MADAAESTIRYWLVNRSGYLGLALDHEHRDPDDLAYSGLEPLGEEWGFLRPLAGPPDGRPQLVELSVTAPRVEG